MDKHQSKKNYFLKRNSVDDQSRKTKKAPKGFNEAIPIKAYNLEVDNDNNQQQHHN